jgi:hypothetical protein
MKFKAEPWQRFLVLSMMFGETDREREPKFGEVKNPRAARRKELLTARILRSEKRGRAQHLLLDDGAWDFVIENLGQPLPPTSKAGKVLERVLGKLGPFLENQGSAFSDFVHQSGPAAARQPGPAPASELTEQELRAVCLSLGGGQTGKRIRLADLRAKLTASRESLDELLQSMQQAGRLVLFKLDNPAEITPDDEKAALHIAGYPRHLVYLEA